MPPRATHGSRLMDLIIRASFLSTSRNENTRHFHITSARCDLWLSLGPRWSPLNYGRTFTKEPLPVQPRPNEGVWGHGAQSSYADRCFIGAHPLFIVRQPH